MTRTNNWMPALAAVTLAALSGCNSIGDGNTVERLEIVPANGATQLVPYAQGGTYKMFECFRDEFVAVAVFTDGTRSNFSYRATWSSSNPAVAEVSNYDIAPVFATGSTDGSFYVHPTVKLVPGTVVPHGVAGDTAVVTAEFAGLKASINLAIRKANLRIVAVPSDSNTVSGTTYLAQKTSQRFTVLADADGRTVTAAELTGGSQNGYAINPFRWSFADGTFEARDTGVFGDFDKWVVTGTTGRVATINTVSGTVFGTEADFAPHQVVAEQQLCQAADATLRPVTNAQVVKLYQDPGKAVYERLALSPEPAFGTFPAGDIVGTTTEQLKLVGALDIDNDGDGLPAAAQDFNSQVRYSALPKNESCEDSTNFLGCFTNDDLSVPTNGLMSGLSTFTDGDHTRVQACFPVCLPPRATLEASVSGNSVDFTAAAIDPPPGVTVQYLFDFGDGTPTVGPQASATTSHNYVDGAYTASVRLVDADHAAEEGRLSQNAGATRVLVNTAPTGTDPVGVLSVAGVLAGEAPLTVSFNADSSHDADDAITVYEFDFGDGSPKVRQTRPTTEHVYLDETGSPFTPTVTVYDTSGNDSAPATGSVVTVTGSVPEIVLSNVYDFRVRDATLCSISVQPGSVTEAAFTFPGTPFKATGSFVQNTDTDTCTDTPIGEQDITRYMTWLVMDPGTDTRSSIVQPINGVIDFFAFAQLRYLSDVTTSTTLDVAATPFGIFSEIAAPARPTLTVTPCTSCTP